MASYEVRYQCGHTGTVNLFGPTRERERKLEWMARCACPDCQKEREQKAIEKRTQELSLPELKGTEKQVAWAQRIRLSRLEELDKTADQCNDRIIALQHDIESARVRDPERASLRLANMQKTLELVMMTAEGARQIAEASWWIEHRDDNAEYLCKAYQDRQGLEMERAIEAESKPAMLVMEPEEKKTNTVATMKASEKEIAIRSDKDEHIRLTIKQNGFVWDGARAAWVKPITEMTGAAKDLAPDTARILLEAGIPVRAYPDILDAVRDGSYEKECKRWIRVSPNGDRLAIRKVSEVKAYPDGKDTWDGDVLVKPELWREVREFADLSGYKITQKAEAMLRRAEAATVTVTPASKPDDAHGDPLKAILESSRDILEDLKEED